MLSLSKHLHKLAPRERLRKVFMVFHYLPSRILPWNYQKVYYPKGLSPHRNSWEGNGMKNEILEELWEAKDQLAHEYDYDIEKLVKELRKKEKETGISVIDLTSQPKSVTARL